MPTPEEIKKIARRFELDMYPTMPDMLSAKAMLEWLSKDYCIVPKSKVKAEYKKSYSAAFEHTTCLDLQYARGRYQVLREIFGKSLFEEEK